MTALSKREKLEFWKRSYLTTLAHRPDRRPSSAADAAVRDLEERNFECPPPAPQPPDHIDEFAGFRPGDRVQVLRWIRAENPEAPLPDIDAGWSGAWDEAHEVGVTRFTVVTAVQMPGAGIILAADGLGYPPSCLVNLTTMPLPEVAPPPAG